MKKLKDHLLNIYVIINILFIFICSFAYIGLKVPYYYFGKAIIWALGFNIVISITSLLYFCFKNDSPCFILLILYINIPKIECISTNKIKLI